MPRNMKYKLGKVVGTKTVYKPITIGEKNLVKAIGVKKLKSILRRRSKEAPVKESRKKIRVPRRSVSFSDQRSFAKYEKGTAPTQCIVEKGIEMVKHKDNCDLTDKLESLKC